MYDGCIVQHEFNSYDSIFDNIQYSITVACILYIYYIYIYVYYYIAYILT